MVSKTSKHTLIKPKNYHVTCLFLFVLGLMVLDVALVADAALPDVTSASGIVASNTTKQAAASGTTSIVSTAVTKPQEVSPGISATPSKTPSGDVADENKAENINTAKPDSIAELQSKVNTKPQPKVTFEKWKQNFAEFAIEQGIKQETLDKSFAKLRLDQKVLDLISNQPEFTKPVWEYLDSAASDARVQKGRRLLAKHHKLLARIEESYEVQPEYIIAIWGLESNYGSNFGRKNVIRSLATLAYGSERQAFYQAELLAALNIIQNGDIAAEKMLGSWAGAMGHTQFMPTTYEKYAVDYDGDKRRDLWKSLPDVFASTANYLKSSNWQKDQTWGVEVKFPKVFDWELADPTTWLPVSEWAELGLVRADNRPLNSLDKKEARVFLPAGHNGPAFLVFKNFQAIKQYNNANSYALAVGYLGDRIRGGKELITEWPRTDVPLSRNDKINLQLLLTQLGYDTGGIDGKIGPNTREAIRTWQKEMGLPADGYVNQKILELLR
jgi:membrane-bound lytic murein transglycosylase B